MKSSTRISLALFTLAVLLIASSAALAATRSVPSGAYPTVQSAIDAASPGDTIAIQPGVYFENVTVGTPSLNIVGNCPNPRSVVLDGTDSGTGLDITAADTEVRCLTLRHYSYGIEISAADLYAYKVHFRNADTGIDGDSSGFRVVNCEFFGCEDYSTYLDGVGGTVTGSKSNNSGSHYICGDGLTFQDNSVEQSEDESCLEYDGDGGTIERLHCDGADDYGIDVDGDNNVIRDNYVRSSYDEGIYVDGDGNTVDSNEVINVDDYGIEVCGDNNVIRWNKVTASYYECFYIDGENLLIEGNEATNCSDNGFEIDGDSLIVKDNTVVSVADDSGFDIDCRGPYTGIPPFYYEPCTFASITGNTTKSTGEDYEGFDISGENMVIRQNRVDNAFAEGFYLSVDDSTIESNRAYWTGSEHEEGFYIRGDRNTIRFNQGFYNAGSCMELRGDDNLLRSNVCRENLADGIEVNGAGNRLMFNVAQGNEGEGIQNGGTDTVLFRNTATNNRIDCADDGGTISMNVGNNCADGSDLATTPQEIDP